MRTVQSEPKVRVDSARARIFWSSEPSRTGTTIWQRAPTGCMQDLRAVDSRVLRAFLRARRIARRMCAELRSDDLTSMSCSEIARRLGVGVSVVWEAQRQIATLSDEPPNALHDARQRAVVGGTTQLSGRRSSPCQRRS